MIHLGTSGWYYDNWEEIFYPKDIEKNQWLEFYSQKFDTVEVNASFYRLPFKNMIKGWKNKTPENFLLTFKGSKLITHNKKLKNSEDYLEKFFNRIKLAQNKIGVILWQLPPKVKKDVNLLEDFLNKLSSDYNQCIEFRHKSWFNNDEVINLLKKYNTAYCIISAPNLPSTVKVTADFAYIRWHGKDDWYRYNYSNDELNSWATQIKKIEVDEIYGYFNNDFEGLAPKNCLKLKEILGV